MKKFCVFSGFLGSGKTSTMIALTKYFSAHRGLAAMISNDLGNQSLADNKLALLAGSKAGELVGDCICYQTENLASRLNSLFNEEGCSLVISDIPGFGVGALDHVYHTLSRDYPDLCSLAPFTVLTEPRTVELLREDRGGDMDYILRAQLTEADLIVLNKCDLLSPARRDSDLEWLRSAYPEARVLAISARSGEGLEELCNALTDFSASLRLPDIGYCGADFGAAMGRLSEFYMQYYARVCCNDFDGSAYLRDMGEAVRCALEGSGCDIPHLKLLAWEPEGDYGKADLLGLDRPVELSRAFSSPSTELAVMLNASALCPGDVLDDIIRSAVEEVSSRYDLELVYYKHECFGMGG